MTPAARIAAAIGILDRIEAGEPAEKALTGWARRSRFAGSGDRAAVRDHVFDVLRCRRSCAALGGGESGRALMLGLLRRKGLDPGEVFTGKGHAPAPLTPEERRAGRAPEGGEALDMPDWLLPDLATALGGDLEEICRLFQARAPVWLRVNERRCSREEARALLAREGIVARPSGKVKTALEIIENARRIRQSEAWKSGCVELQDLNSQALCADLPLGAAPRVLDYCAGGGGKVLALAARAPEGQYLAHDADFARMKDLPQRAARAGAEIRLIKPGEAGAAAPFDLVLCDVPCSGSGAWRRSPEGKWRLDAGRLEELMRIQSEILDKAKELVSEGGQLAYATCSLLAGENEARIDAFLTANPGWECCESRRYSPLSGGDGFFLARLVRKPR